MCVNTYPLKFGNYLRPRDRARCVDNFIILQSRWRCDIERGLVILKPLYYNSKSNSSQNMNFDANGVLINMTYLVEGG